MQSRDENNNLLPVDPSKLKEKINMLKKKGVKIDPNIERLIKTNASHRKIPSSKPGIKKCGSCGKSKFNTR
jgi:hypothetical protein